jgi:hypothetical protein
MKAALALGRYQWTELVVRWRMQPASPLARGVLTFALCSAAAVLFLGFAAAESARKAELRRLGLDTLVVQASAGSSLPDTSALPPDHWAAPLQARGELIVLQQLPEPALNPWGDQLPVFEAPARTLNALAPGLWRHGGVDALWLTRRLPYGHLIRVTRGSLRVTARTLPPSGSLQALGLDDCLLLPATGSADARGRVDVVLFTPRSSEGAGDDAASVRRLFEADGATPPVIRDPSPYRMAFERFTRSQERWRRGMAILLCLCVVLTFASIAVLEEKQTRFAQALLRSLGVPGSVLWVFSLLENALLANLALLAALAASRAGASAVLFLTGSGAAPPGELGTSGVVWLACAVNAGVLVSLLPLARALRRPVGTVLA